MQYIIKRPDLYIFGVEGMFMLFSQKEKKRLDPMSWLQTSHRGVPETTGERSLVWPFLPPRRGVLDNRTCSPTLQGILPLESPERPG